jgi:hypothetical protein
VFVTAERAVVECAYAIDGAKEKRIEGMAGHNARATPPLTSSHVSLSIVVKD